MSMKRHRPLETASVVELDDETEEAEMVGQDESPHKAGEDPRGSTVGGDKKRSRTSSTGDSRAKDIYKRYFLEPKDDGKQRSASCKSCKKRISGTTKSYFNFERHYKDHDPVSYRSY